MKKIKTICMLSALVATTVQLTACGNQDPVKLDPKNPTTIYVWNYYSGKILESFKNKVTEFNDGYGKQKGIIVDVKSFADVGSLETAVIAAAKKEVGSGELPNVFSTYADTAFELEKMDILADIEKYFPKKEQDKYINSYIEEGKIGKNGELRIFPIAKSTEALMINETDWKEFSESENVTYNDLKTMEGVADVANKYYDWSDSLTPDIENDGKAFFGRDSLANFLIITAKELGKEMFVVNNGEATITVDETVMKKIWDNYYVPIISGHFLITKRFCSDDTKTGKLLSYVGSTASASFFPGEVVIEQETEDDIKYPITAKVLPVPHFANATKAIVQQGAGMAVTKGTDKQEFASVSFLKWFTDVQTNIEFSAAASYLPVKKEANNFDTFITKTEAAGITMNAVTKETFRMSFAEIAECELYTTKAFNGGIAARAVVNTDLHNKAALDRIEVIKMLEEGLTLEEAIAHFNTDDAFELWLESFTASINAVISN